MDLAPRRILGRTGLTVSPIGFGGFKIGRNQGIKYDSAYDLPTEAAAEALLNAVLDLGIDLIDTAPAYGSSEERIGGALAARRSEFTLTSKVGETWEDGAGRYDFSATAIDHSLDRSLRRLRTDRIDVVFIHSDGNDLEIIEHGDALETLARRRDAGDIAAIGFSGKTIPGHQAAIDTGLVDCLMVEYHSMDESQRVIIDRAESAGIGVLIKKGLASGRLRPEEAIPHCLAPSGVSSVIIGSLTLAHLASNLDIARRACGQGEQGSQAGT